MVRAFRRVGFLRAVTVAVAAVTLAAQVASIFTPEWLHTVEKMENKQYIKFNMSLDLEYYEKVTLSGLFKLCWEISEY